MNKVMKSFSLFICLMLYSASDNMVKLQTYSWGSNLEGF